MSNDLKTFEQRIFVILKMALFIIDLDDVLDNFKMHLMKIAVEFLN